MKNIEKLKSMTNVVVKQQQSEKDHSISMYKIGRDLLASQYHLTIRQLGKVTGMSYVELSLAKTIAKQFYTEKDFENYLVSIKSYKWKDVKKNLRKKTSVMAPETAVLRLYETIKSIKRFIRDKRTMEHSSVDLYVTELNKIRNLITKFIPKQQQIIDENYISYNNCTCCGEYPPPPEGFGLQFIRASTGKKIYYPVCKSCEDLGIEPDFKVVAELYFHYALNLEEAFETLVI